MNVRPISASFTAQAYNRCQPKPAVTTAPAFKGDENQLRNSLAAMALGSAVALSSCEKDDCTHPNHKPIDPKPPIDDPDDPDLRSKTYELPSLKIDAYKIKKDTLPGDKGIKTDTVRLGTVSLSQAYVVVPNDLRDRTEFSTMQNMIDILGLETTPVNKEYVTKAFANTELPSQMVWLDEKSGDVSQLLFNGTKRNTDGLVFELLRPGKETVAKQVLIKDAGNGKLLSRTIDLENNKLLSDKMYELDGSNVVEYVKDFKTDKYIEKYIYSKSDGKSVLRKDVELAEVVKLSQFNVRSIVPKD